VNNPDITPATTTHDGPEINPLGDEVIAHPISPTAKFEPEMVTRTPAPPDGGDSEIVGSTRNGADLDVLLGFEVTVTVEIPGTAVPTTVNEPVTTPPVIEHGGGDDAMISGAAVMAQVPSAEGKPVPSTATTMPVGPKLGTRLKADADLVKVGADTGPSELGKVTVYGPGAGGIPATEKVPVIWKVIPEMLQDTPDSNPAGVLNKVPTQPAAASAALKPEPVIETGAKDSPLKGTRVITGVTAKLPVAKPPPPPFIWTVQVPPCAVALTVKEAERAPVELIAHEGVGTPAKRFDPDGAVIPHGNPRSSAPKEPAGAVTVTAPTVVGPENGKIVNATGRPFVIRVEAVSAPKVTPWTIIVYRPLGLAGSRVKIPTTVPTGLTVQGTPEPGGVPNAASSGTFTPPSQDSILTHAIPAPISKPEPERVTSTPLGLETGDTAIRGTTAKVGAFIAASPPSVPVTVSV